MKRLMLVVSLLAGLCAGACDPDGGSAVLAEALIGPEGGVLESPDGRVRLEVPAGALAESKRLTVAEREAVADFLPGSLFEFTPDGTEFAVPATLRVAYAAEALPAGADTSLLTLGKLIEFEGEQLVLTHGAPAVDPAKRTIAASIDGFSSHGGTAVAHIPCASFSGTITATYQPDRTIDVAWQSPLSTALVEVARLTNVVAGTPGALTPRESDYQPWIQWAAGSRTAIYPAGDDAALLYFRVRPRCGQTLGQPSAPAMVTVFGKPRLPHAPQGLRATASAHDEVTLEWTADAWADHHELERTVDGLTWKTYPRLGGQQSSFTDRGDLTAQTRYIYRIRALNSLGQSPWAQVAVNTPAPGAAPAPSGLLASAVSPTAVYLEWSVDATKVDAVEITRQSANGAPAVVTVVPNTQLNYEDTGLTPDTAWVYTLTSRRGGQPGAAASVNVATPPLPTVGGPGGSTTTTCEHFDITLSPGVAKPTVGAPALVDITIARKGGFSDGLALMVEGFCEGRLPLCEFGYMSFCADGECGAYTGIVAPGQTKTRLRVEVDFVIEGGFSTVLEIVDPAYPNCRAQLPVEVK
ncbi:MAG: hypothetical protein R3F39_26070 [Myxococcota bacterium]